MSTRDYTANVISATPVVPDGAFQNSAASGVWDINEALDLIKGGNWPTTGNFNPAAFVDGLFSTFVYTGTSDTSLAINNDLDLTKGGLVWTKERTNNGGGHILFSTDASGNHSGLLVSSSTAAAGTGYQPDYFTFRNNGYTTTNTVGDSKVNGREYVSWSFRNQPKFFDVVAYDGTGSARTISHNLGSVPGMIMIKHLNGSNDWHVYHRSTDSSAPEDYILHTNTNDARSDETIFNDTAPTSSVFSVNDNIKVNGGGGNKYVAYLFAHNNSDGGFGEPGDQDIIKCDTFTNSGSTVSVNLGFEPQFIMFKNASSTGSWFVVDSMRGIFNGSTDPYVTWDGSGAEANLNAYTLTSTGFDIDGSVLGNGDYIYMAIRRGGMQTPTAATNVFAIDTMANQTPAFDSTFPVDMVIRRNIGGVNTNTLWTRLTGQKYMNTNASDVESNDSETFDSNVGFGDGSTYSDNHAYMWARARGYFDVVTYTGNSTNNHEIKHNLGVAPEMVWTKQRTTDARSWVVYHSALGNTNTLALDTNGKADDESSGMHANPTASSIFLKAVNSTNASNQDYIAHFFATVAGVSKVGSFTQSGATNVACGFTGSTPALIILKRTDASGDWYLFDSLRGIVAGNDPYFILNDTTAPTTNADMVDPYSGGFATTSNIADGSYIFYAIAAIS